MSRLALRIRFFGSHIDAIVETWDYVTLFFSGGFRVPGSCGVDAWFQALLEACAV
jgi:hypothetical protein